MKRFSVFSYFHPEKKIFLPRLRQYSYPDRLSGFSYLHPFCGICQRHAASYDVYKRKLISGHGQKIHGHLKMFGVASGKEKKIVLM